MRDCLFNVRHLLVNPSYLAVFCCWMILAVSGGILAVVGTYTFVYAFEFTTEQIAIRDVVRLPGAFLCVAVSLWPEPSQPRAPPQRSEHVEPPNQDGLF